MTTKVILLFVLFFVNLFGFFSLTSTLINCPFRVFFGGKNHKSGAKIIYWIGHIVLVLLIFYAWEEITETPPTFVLILTLFLSSLLSFLYPVIDKKFYNKYRLYLISDTVKLAFVYNLVILYILGLIFNKFLLIWY
jgi:hypothetical protein